MSGKGNLVVHDDGRVDGGGALRVVFDAYVATLSPRPTAPAQLQAIAAIVRAFCKMLDFAGDASALGGDAIGPPGGNTVQKIQHVPVAAIVPALFQILGSPDAATWTPRYEGYPIARVTVTFGLTGGSTVDGVLFTVPATPSGAARFVVSRFFVRLSTVLGAADSGTVNLRVGTSLGGNELMTDQTVDKTTAVNMVGGYSIATYGASLPAYGGYEAVLAAGDVVRLRATTVGTITAGAATAYLWGYFLP